MVGLLLFVSALTLTQAGIVGPSYGQFVTQTTYPPGLPTTWHAHPGNRTWTNQGNHTWNWNHTWNRTFTRTGNLTWAWTHTGNQTWARPGNLTRHRRGIGLLNGWAQSNVTVAFRNVTQPISMNGTQGVRLDFIAINATSSNQIIRNVAFNGTVAQIEFDHNGSVQLIVNSSVKPSQVFADGNLLSEAQSSNMLTPQSDAWTYDLNSHTVTIFADPSSVTLVYTLTAPVPEYPSALPLALVGCLTITLLFSSRMRKRKR